MVKEPSRLELLRRGRGLTQEELAKLLGLKRNAIIAQVEARKLASYPKLRRGIVELFGIDERNVFDEKGFAKLARQR